MKEENYRAFFFDLDGTLLPLDTHIFLKKYFASVDEFMESKGAKLETFTPAFKKACHAMSDNCPKLTNAERFWNVLYEQLGKTNDQGLAWKDLFEEYYARVFPGLGPMFDPFPQAYKVLKVLKEKGYALVLTTMPVFPLEALKTRLSWAEIDINIFDRVTYMDNSHSVKPRAEYFQENLDICSCKSSEVVMVGNNTFDDLACTKVGITPYLVTNYLINEQNVDLKDIAHGTMQDLLKWVESLPPCKDSLQCK